MKNYHNSFIGKVALVGGIACSLILGDYSKQARAEETKITEISIPVQGDLDTLNVKKNTLRIPEGQENKFSYNLLHLDNLLHNKKADILFGLNDQISSYNKVKKLYLENNLQNAEIEDMANSAACYLNIKNLEDSSFFNEANYDVLKENKTLLNDSLHKNLCSLCEREAEKLLSKKRLFVREAEELYKLKKVMTCLGKEIIADQIYDKLIGGKDYVLSEENSENMESLEQKITSFTDKVAEYNGTIDNHIKNRITEKEGEIENLSDDQFINSEEEEEFNKIKEDLKHLKKIIEQKIVRGEKIKYIQFNDENSSKINSLIN